MAYKAIKIMLDPGHDKAKYNQGAAPGYWEGAQMWRLYQFLRPALERRGFIVAGTKSRCDQSVDVVTRGRMARGYDVFISLHSNAAGDKSVDRPVGIYFVDDNCGPIDEESKELAVLLAGVVAEVMGTRHRAETYSSKSSRDRDGDGKKNDDYYGMLYGAHQSGTPGIILEHSFHTNPDAAAWLLDDDNLRRLAEAEADALAEYYGMAGVKDTTPPIIKKEGTPVEMENLKRGSKGAQVRVLQALLRGFGITDADGKALAVDGSYGAKTEQAVKKYQAANKDTDGKPLTADGKAGPKTWGSLLAQ